MKTKTIAWLAGLLEGEGCFLWQKPRWHGAERQGRPRVILAMTDRDVIDFVAALWRTGVSLRWPKGQPVNKQQMYVAEIQSRKAAAWMMTVYSLMHSRRRAKIALILKQWKLQKDLRRGQGLAGFTEVGRRLNVRKPRYGRFA